MKKSLIFIFLLISSFAHSQGEKDSLFKRDASRVYDTLKVMNYLENVVSDYYTMPVEDKNEMAQIFQYHLRKNIIGNNPVASIDILRFLEIYLQKDIPQDWDSFIDKVHNTNAKMLLLITNKYGYPSFRRIKRFTGINSEVSLLNFAIRPSNYQEALGKMLRKEKRNGNVSKRELEIFKMMAGRMAISSDEIMKKKLMQRQ